MLTGRYEAGVRMCKELLARSPNNVPGHAILVQTYAEWGRDEDARAAAQELLRVDPRFSAVRRAKSLPFKDLTLQTHYLELMRKAGLPD
jgi:adenylate cyclase